jgi:4-diphosphocytidyl-2-C-methyl-D-erythritol kinase
VKNFKIKSYCKINLYLKIVKKLSNNYHNIRSLITFCHLHDIITISELRSNKDKISFSGKYHKGISKKKNTVISLLYLLRESHQLKNQFFKINIQKNIPHGSGLGSGSSNAATLLNYFNKRMNLKLNKNKLLKISNKIGFDVPINLERKNVFLTGKKDKILRLKKKFRLNILILYPNIKCSTQKIYQSNKQKNYSKIQSSFLIKNKVALINFLKKEHNDLEKNVIKFYPKIKKIINTIKSQKGCHLSRITGSGSACIGIFSTMKNAISAKKLIKLKYPKYWCDVSKTI